MNNRSNKLFQLVAAAMIAALYTALSLALGALSFGVGGAIQVRVAEAFTLLPVISPCAIWGVTVGCALTNAAGLAMGMNIAGAADILLGTAATLAAACMTWLVRNVRYRGIPYLAWLPPVVMNAIVVGGEITYVVTGSFAPGPLLLNMAYVGLGEALSCGLLGLPMLYALEKTGVAERIFGRFSKR